MVQSSDEVAIKHIIVSEDSHLRQVLRLINTEGSGKGSHESRSVVNKYFMNYLVEVKCGLSSALLWLKANVDPDICGILLSDYDYSGSTLQVFKKKCIEWKEGAITFIANYMEHDSNHNLKTLIKFNQNFLSRFVNIASLYLDLALDSILLGTIFLVLGSLKYELFTTQVALLLLASIIVPSVITAIEISVQWPLVVVGLDMRIQCKKSNENVSYGKILLVQVLTACLSPIIPALVVMSEEEAKQKLKAIKSKIDRNKNVQKSDLMEIELITSFLDECNLSMLAFKRNELSLELVIQLSVHVSMVLLSQTDFPLQSGLQSIFESNDSKGKVTYEQTTALILLIISILWSFKTSVMTAIKIKTHTKQFLPLLSKFLLGIRYFLVFTTRIGAIVAYFSPFLGLLGIMNHYQAEILPLDPGLWQNFNPDSKLS